MDDTNSPNSVISKTTGDNTAVKTTLITVLGTIVVAALTTFGTIWASRGEIQKNAAKLDTLKSQADALTKRDIPVGTVIASLLTPVEFAKEVGDSETFDLKESKWTLADGKSVSGTAWARLRDNATIPNLCGVFLRGKNNGKFLVGREKDQNNKQRNDIEDIELGAYKDDIVGPHKHVVRAFDSKGTIPGASIWWDGGKGFVVRADDQLVAGVEGAPTETQPKNVTVNYFIKINE